MNCPHCGDDCRCVAEPSSAEVEAQATDVAGVRVALSKPVEPDASTWREEVSARLTRYRARRKPKPPRYPSLRLRFDGRDAPESGSSNAGQEKTRHDIPPAFETASHQALALDDLTQVSLTPGDAESDSAQSAEATSLGVKRGSGPVMNSSTACSSSAQHSGAKIIEFPRFGHIAPVSRDELAEPVVDHPRILEVPEVAPPPPALGGITIEAAHPDAPARRRGIEFPLQTAPLARRFAAATIDGAIVAAASALFGFTFWKVTNFQPPLIQMLALAATIPLLLWVSYQYLLLVYSASTPGLRLAHLELQRFEGSRASRRLRRWRVLASCLSAFSLGMGYVWVFLDEDALCWHDRITRTCFAHRK